MSEFFARAWINYFNIPNLDAYSAGVEVTEVHEHVLTALDDAGFLVSRAPRKLGNQHPVVLMGSERFSRQMYSKSVDDELLPKYNFVTIAVCDHAAETCPIMSGSLGRFVLPFEDPGIHDGEEDAVEYYITTRDEIASTLFLLFNKLVDSL